MSFTTGEGGGVKAGSVPGGPSREIGCRVIDLMRRATPKGAQKPWKTQYSISLIASIAADIDEISLMEHVEGCAQVVEAGLEDPIYWTVRQLFTDPNLSWWRGKVAKMEVENEAREARVHDQAREREREAAEKLARRAQHVDVPAQLAVRRALRDEPTVEPARAQSLAAGLVAKLTGRGEASRCTSCPATVQAGEPTCPACGAQLIDRRGVRRVGS